MFDADVKFSDLKTMSSHDFRTLGMRDFAYIRPVVLDEQEAFAIHAADGTPLSVLGSFSDAVMAVHQNDLLAVTVH